MTKEDFWIHKIKAFLSTSPVISLFPNDKEQVKSFVATALNLEPSEIDLDSLEETKAIAKGFDIPPFIENILLTNEIRENLVFKHPLSGEEIKLDLDVSKIDKDKINNLINDSIAEIRKEVKEQKNLDNREEFNKRLFFALWRKLTEIIREKEAKTDEAKIGKYWDWLPADPRIPTHSVWEHSSIVSAIAGAESEPSLLIFTIASPQQFISAARRTQDSWMGSFLYSFLMWEAIKTISDEFGPDCFLFPDLRHQPLVDTFLKKEKGIQGLPNYSRSDFQVANFPNILTAILPANKAADAIKDAQRAMKKKWKEIAEIIRVKIEHTLQDGLQIEDTSNWKRIWNRQIDNFLSQNVFWVVCPWQDGEKNPLEVYKKLFNTDDTKTKKRIDDFEKLLETTSKGLPNSGMFYQCFSTIASRALTARKNLRDFHNKSQEEGEKCSLCGEREALHPDSKSNNPARYRDQRLFWQNLGSIERLLIKDDLLEKDGEEVKFAGRIKRGDFLCAICLLKRLALDFYFNEKRKNGFDFERHLFPSTATIATAPFKAKIIKWCEDKDENLKCVKNYNYSVKKFLRKINLYYPSASVPKLEKRVKDFNEGHQPIIEEFLRIDGQWLSKESFYSFESEIGKKLLNDIGLSRLRKEAIKSLDDLLKKFKIEFKQVNPSSYYAVISMDGDKIGEWLNGKNAPTIESLLHPMIADKLQNDKDYKSILGKKRPLGVVSHLSLSIALKNFALNIAPKIIEEENYGKLIFAGGDDLLAFVPTENLLNIVNQLHKFFQGENFKLDDGSLVANDGIVEITDSSSLSRNILVAGTKTSSKSEDKETHQLTASFGVSIIHESYPLPLAIEEAFSQAMKETAKEKLGRNAIAFHLLKRAGSPFKVGFKFENNLDTENTLILLQKLLELIKDGSLSSRIAYTMNSRKSGLDGSWNDVSNDPADKTIWWHDAQIQTLRYLTSRQAKKSEIPRIEGYLTSLLKILYLSWSGFPTSSQ